VFSKIDFWIGIGSAEDARMWPFKDCFDFEEWSVQVYVDVFWIDWWTDLLYVSDRQGLYEISNQVFCNDHQWYIGSLQERKRTKREEEHIYLVLQKFWDHRPNTKLSKYEFWMKQVSFLSHIISEEGISMDPCKIWDMLSWNALASIANIWSPLGLVGYY
jgi:hypothetical protein